MEILLLGGTAWLGRTCAAVAVARGHVVTCLARGESGDVASGSRLVIADRFVRGAYDQLRTQRFDAAIEVSWQPGMVREAAAALRDRCGQFIYVSSVSAYLSHDTPGADESADLLPSFDGEVATLEHYGEAKVACEQAVQEIFGDSTLIARAGLIGGPGDGSGRTGAWVARVARDREGAMLVPTQGCAVQVIGARDLATWLVDCAEQKTNGTFNAVGPSLRFREWVERSRAIGGHVGPVVEASPDFLEAQGVSMWMGPDSAAMWVTNDGRKGWGQASGAKAIAAGLRHQDRDELLTETLEWERNEGLDRERRAGLSAQRERELLTLLGE